MASPGLPVKRVADADDERYSALLSGQPEATFFHTRDWTRIVTTGFPGLADASGVYRVGDDFYALPLFRWKRLGGLLTTTHSSFPFLYGGPIPARTAAVAALLNHLADGPGSLFFQGNPFVGAADSAADWPATGLPAEDEATYILRLPDSADGYWNDVLTTQKRNDIRRAMKKGVTIERSNDRADIATVYALYLQRMETWSQRPGIIYPLSFYEAMVAQGGDAVRLYIARSGEQLIGGTFICRWNHIVHYNAGYFDGAYRHLRPNIVIQERIIRDAIEDGFRLYDLLPSAGLRNVEEFKESFGAVRTRFPRWRRTGRLHRLAGRIRSRHLTRADASGSSSALPTEPS